MNEEQPNQKKIIIKKPVVGNAKLNENIDLPIKKKQSKKNFWKNFKLILSKRANFLFLFLILLVLIGLFYFINSSNGKSKENQLDTNEKLENYDSVIEVLSEDCDLQKYLIKLDIAQSDIHILHENAIKFNLSNLNIGDKITIFYKNKTNHIIDHIIIEPKSQVDKSFKLNMNNLSVIAIKKNVEVRQRYGFVLMDSSLLISVLNNNLPITIIEKMESILGYSIDFFHLNKGDIFKIIFNEKFNKNQSLGVDQIIAIQYIGKNKKVEAFSYFLNEQLVYIDEYGMDLKKSFLLSPLQYGRITSSFNLNRLHPVTGVMKAHFGTDYAAPEGTPILSVADGVIEKYETKMETNGNYAKIRHDNTYESQYLHMSAFVEGLKVGTRVKQGQIIGFVGQTGLATGPHVCFRFWRNGQQVNHLEENLPSGKLILNAIEKEKFDPIRDSLNTLLVNIDGVN